MSKSRVSTSDHVKHEATGWGVIILGGLALLFLAPVILSGVGGAVVSAVPEAAEAATCWPTAPLCPPERVRGGAATTPPTTAAAQMTQKELEARMQAKSVGDGLAAARVVPPTPAPSSGLPQLDGSNTGGIAARLPVLGGAIKALTAGNGMKAIGK